MRNTVRAKESQVQLPYDPEREFASASYRTKQLIILATDAVLARFSIHDDDQEGLTAQLVKDRVLPGCYQERYDECFLKTFAGVLAITRNLLVSDCPFVPNTFSELAARAIFTTAHRILAAQGVGWQGQAGDVDPRLPEQLEVNSTHLADELDAFQDATLEDTDVLALFSLPGDRDPAEYLSPQLRPAERLLLRFENWLIPFGNAPRPHITYDGRAWPVGA